MAQWAGHGVAVLMRVYASALDGREAAAMRLIEVALEPESSSEEGHEP